MNNPTYLEISLFGALGNILPASKSVVTTKCWSYHADYQPFSKFILPLLLHPKYQFHFILDIIVILPVPLLRALLKTIFNYQYLVSTYWFPLRAFLKEMFYCHCLISTCCVSTYILDVGWFWLKFMYSIVFLFLKALKSAFLK